METGSGDANIASSKQDQSAERLSSLKNHNARGSDSEQDQHSKGSGPQEEEDQIARESNSEEEEAGEEEDQNANDSGPSSEHDQGNDSEEHKSDESTLEAAPLVIDDQGMIRILTSKIRNQPIMPPCPNILDFEAMYASVFNHLPESLIMFQDARCDRSNAWYFFQKGATDWIRRDVAAGYWNKYSLIADVLQEGKKIGTKKKHKFFRLIDEQPNEWTWFIDEYRVNMDSSEFERKLPLKEQYILCKLYKAIESDTPPSSSSEPEESGASSQDQGGDDENPESTTSSESGGDENLEHQTSSQDQAGDNLNSDCRTSSKDQGGRFEDSDHRTSSQDQVYSAKRGSISSDYSMDSLSKKVEISTCDRTSSR